MKKHKTMSQIDRDEETLFEELGAFTFLQEIIRALDYDTKEEIYDYIATCHDIDLEENNNED